MLRLIDSGICSAQDVMNRDATLLSELTHHNSEDLVLHHYEWKGDAATYGYFVDPFQCLSKDAVRQCQLSLGRRPTGGGLIFHLTDLAFSLLVPAKHPAYSVNTLENYSFVNHIVIDALEQFLGREFSFELLPQETVPIDHACRQFCMAKPTKYDVMLGGRKVGGAAQRRTRWGFLHQGSIQLAPVPQGYLKRLLLPGTQVAEAMECYSENLLGATLGSSCTGKHLSIARNALRHHLTKCCENAAVVASSS